MPSAISPVWAIDFGVIAAIPDGDVIAAAGIGQPESAIHREDSALVLQLLAGDQRIEDLGVFAEARSGFLNGTPWNCSITSCPEEPRPSTIRPSES